MKPTASLDRAGRPWSWLWLPAWVVCLAAFFYQLAQRVPLMP